MIPFLFQWLYEALIQVSKSAFNTEFAKNIESNKLNIVNRFPGCLIHLINFQGLNLHMSQITQPVVLLRYFSFPNDFYLYPIEKIPIKLHKFTRWTKTLNVAAFEKTRKVRFNNKTLSFIKITFFREAFNTTKSFRLSIKNTNCELNNYLYPPLRKNSPFIYKKSKRLKDYILKDPLYMYYTSNFDSEKWRNEYDNIIPKYSLLICDD